MFESMTALDGALARLAVADPAQQYAQTLTELDAYSSFMQAARLPPDDGSYPGYARAAAIFQSLRENAIRWPNTILPLLLSTPRVIVDTDGPFRLELANSRQLAAELQKNPTEQGKEELRKVLLAEMEILGGLVGSMQRLLDEVRAFVTLLGHDAEAAEEERQTLYRDQSDTYRRLSSLHARLAELRRAACPDKAAIQRTQGEIAAAERTLRSIQSLADVFSQVTVRIRPAQQGTSYVEGYWTGLSDDGKAALAGLERGLADPLSMTPAMIAQGEAAWAVLVEQARVILSTASTMRWARRAA